MNEISLVFYGELSKVQNHLLFHLKLLKLLPATETRTGFYAIESRYGREIPKKLSLESNCDSGEAVLLYRYLSEEELQKLEASATKSVAFYILPHKLFDRDYIKKALLTRIPQAGFISDFSGTSLVHSFNLVRKEFKTGNILRLKSGGPQQGENEYERSTIQLPVLILFLLKIFMNPVNEIRRYSLLIKYSNLRFLSRFLELLLALNFVINAVFLKLFRRLVLRIRQAVLISIFKLYGLVFDCCTFSYRFTKLILLYPIFKIYWFVAFQYEKRIKKWLS